MRLVFINRFYWPDSPATAQLLTDLAGALAEQGHEVIVIAGRPVSGSQPGPAPEQKVWVRRVRSTHFGKRNLLAHGIDFVTYAANALLTLSLTLKPGDVVIVLTDPPLFNVLALPIARLRGARLINWVQDIYPEVALLLTGRRLFGWLRPIRNWAWRNSEACVTLGRDMGAVLLDAGVSAGRLHLIPNWAPEGLVPLNASASARLRKEWGLTGKFVVAYFGNLGRVHDLDAILEIAQAVRADTDIVFCLVGAGAQRARLEAAVRANGLENVRFFPEQARERRTEILALGDAHLVTLRPGCERVVFPSKLYGICAAARPVVFIGPVNSEIASIIMQHRLGLVHARSDIAGVVRGLRRLRDVPDEAEAFARTGRAFYEQQGRLQHATRLWLKVLTAASNPTASAA